MTFVRMGVLLGWLGLLVGTGCSTPKMFKMSGDDTAPLRGKRREVALREFETHRDTAQYQAAMDRWKAGDAFTCEAQLRGVVGRNPQHREARRALADLAMERGDVAAAEHELRELLKIAPDDAQTHHSLGLLLESQQRSPEAAEHLVQAATLEPDNVLYQMCAATDRASPPGTIADIRQPGSPAR